VSALRYPYADARPVSLILCIFLAMNNKNPAKSDVLKKLEEIRSRVKPAFKPEEGGKRIQAAEQTTETKYKGVQVVDNVESGACQIFFHDFPNPAVRAYLKRHEFKWSPIDQCWGRERSPQAMFHVEKAIDKMTKSR
jgi:hypothetical protein